MAVDDAYLFPGFLTPVLTLFFPKPPTTFLTYFCRGERRKYAGKKSRLNLGSNSQPPGHESNTLATEQPGWGQPFLKHSQMQNYKLIMHQAKICSQAANKPQTRKFSTEQNCRVIFIRLMNLVIDLHCICPHVTNTNFVSDPSSDVSSLLA